MEESLPHLEQSALNPSLLPRGELPAVDGGPVGRPLVTDQEGVSVTAEQQVTGGGIAVVERHGEGGTLPPRRRWPSPEDPDLLETIEPVPSWGLLHIVRAEHLDQCRRKLGRIGSPTLGAWCPPGVLSPRHER